MIQNFKIYFTASLINNWIAFILMIIFTLGIVAFFTLGERKLMGSIQRRKGPNVVGFWGLLQALADGLKLLIKEILLPYKVSLLLFLIGPSLVFFLSLSGWIILPYSENRFFTIINLSLLYVLVSAGFNIYGLILSGWSSNSRYAFLGGVRATAQMISYELVLSLINFIIIFLSGSFNYNEIMFLQNKTIWYIFPLFPIFLIYLIVMLAETNRTPFDLAEAEAEPVAGYNLEYSSMLFALFFLGEYTNMIFLSINAVIFFFCGSYFFGISSESFFIVKVLCFCIFFIWVRATLPRYRYDQLMEIGWKLLLPLLFSILFIIFIYLQWYFLFYNEFLKNILKIFFYCKNDIYDFYIFYYTNFVLTYFWVIADYFIYNYYSFFISYNVTFLNNLLLESMINDLETIKTLQLFSTITLGPLKSFFFSNFYLFYDKKLFQDYLHLNVLHTITFLQKNEEFYKIYKSYDYSQFEALQQYYCFTNFEKTYAPLEFLFQEISPFQKKKYFIQILREMIRYDLGLDIRELGFKVELIETNPVNKQYLLKNFYQDTNQLLRKYGRP
jgi:NADH-quinone oxidoreductase subunit H